MAALIPLLASTVRTIRYADNGRKIAPELKYTSLGSGIHAIAWIFVLILDFWVYY